MASPPLPFLHTAFLPLISPFLSSLSPQSKILLCTRNPYTQRLYLLDTNHGKITNLHVMRTFIASIFMTDYYGRPFART